ncbi:MAG: GAF domain-containing protein [Nitrospinae bacterium]|nr:GAF domain-containing protein [Nitrospinota bacterium]
MGDPPRSPCKCDKTFHRRRLSRPAAATRGSATGDLVRLVILLILFIVLSHIIVDYASHRDRVVSMENQWDSLLMLILILPAIYFFYFRPADLQRREMDRINLEKTRFAGEVAELGKRWHTILDLMDDGVIIINAAHTVEFVNPYITRALGIREGMTCGAATAGLCDAIQTVGAGAATRRQEWTAPDGRMYELFSTPLRGADGGASRLALLHDVTSRKTMERDLRRTTEELERLAAVSKAIISSNNVSLPFVGDLMLDAALKLTGSPIGFVGHMDQKTGALVVPTFTGEVWEICRVKGKSMVFPKAGGLIGWALNSRRPLISNDPANDPRSDGSPEGHLPVTRVILVPAVVGDSQAMGMVAVANAQRDYTKEDVDTLEKFADRYALFVQRFWIESDLKETTAFLTQLLDSIPDPIYYKNVDGIYLGCNNAFARFLGVEKHLVAGATDDHLLPPELAALQKQRDRELLEHRMAQRYETSFPAVMGGDPHDVVYVKAAYQDAAGAVAGLVGVIMDVSDRKRWERSLQETNMALEKTVEELRVAHTMLMRTEKLASLGALSAGVAHEIKNPLNIISTTVQLMMLERPGPDEAPPSYKTILEQVARAVKITDNLRDFARERPPEIRRLPLQEFLERTIALVEYEMTVESNRILRCFPEETVYAEFDPDQMAQVFINLISNARDSLNEKRARLARAGGHQDGWFGELRISLTAGDEQAIIRFEDTGMGIPQQIANRIFDPFFSTKPEKSTGLGLSISYGIVENHGGNIQVESKEGEGAAFTVTLPLKSPHPYQDSQPAGRKE